MAPDIRCEKRIQFVWWKCFCYRWWQRVRIISAPTRFFLKHGQDSSWWTLFVIRCNCSRLLDKQLREPAPPFANWPDWIVKFVLLTDLICTTLLAKLFVRSLGRLLAWNHVTKYLPASLATYAALIVLLRGKLIYMRVHVRVFIICV